MDQGHDNDAPAMMRRRRRIARQQRDKTPDPGAMHQRRVTDDGESSSAIDQNIQTVRMQIRPPGPMSAHESKILRRRDKTFPSSAARSHSQPRQAEKLSSPEATDLIHSAVKRSLSSPRHKDESSEGERYIGEREHRSTSSRYVPSPPRRTPGIDEDKLTRLEQNLQRFEDERRRFEMDKRKFEKEKRDHKLRYKQIVDIEERRRVLENYRKLSDQHSDHEEKLRLIQSMRQPRREAPVPIKAKPKEYESSTALSSSEEESTRGSSKNRILSPARVAPLNVKERKSVSRNSSLSPIRYNDVPNERDSPQRPVVPIRRSVSRNNSLSPIPIPNELLVEKEVSPVRPTPPERKSLSRNASLSPIRSPTPTKPIPETLAEPIESPRVKRTVSNSESESVKLRRKSSRVDRDSEETKRIRHKVVKSDSAKVTQENTQAKKIVGAKKPTKLSESETESVKVAKKRTLTKPIATKPTSPERENASLFSKFLAILKPKKFVPPAHNIVSSAELEKVPAQQESPKERLLTFTSMCEFYTEMRSEWRRLKSDYPVELEKFRCARNLCFTHFMILVMMCGFGGLMFRFVEGNFEDIYKCEVRKVKRDFIDSLWTVSHNLREDDWKSLARNKLRKFEEELHIYHQLGIRTFPGMKPWNFVNSVVYCWTVVTTIGYGHIVPQTTFGRSLTIVYSIIGIPIFLILLADFGKVFTRGMKFWWAYVRRLYYTGTCRKVRKQQHVMDMISGFNTMYDMAMRRPSAVITNGDGEVGIPNDGSHGELGKMSVPPKDGSGGGLLGPATPQSHATHLSVPIGSTSGTPNSQYPETFEIDDEFNLPISLATTILISYILIGALVYSMWESWSYFESFYFVFISMSTIGFGDFVPNHPIFMMCSILYLIFGLALTSMFINVVQIKLSDTFRQASAKIGATIGLSMAEEAESQLQTPAVEPEIALVHQPNIDHLPETTNEEVNSSPPPVPPKRFVSVPWTEESTDKNTKKKFFKFGK